MFFSLTGEYAILLLDSFLHNQLYATYENAYSLKRKLDLVSQYDLAGLALWRLGMEDPAIWEAIQEKVIVK